ncbi:MAG: putative apolipoprotein N-acyltransferase transrane [Rhizobacter sp.]|nr:putative apolipoprotein N-acyltransferase transrane [Rhizobacter sp.]
MRVARTAWPIWLEVLFVAALGVVHAQTFDGSDRWWLQIGCVALFAWRVVVGVHQPGPALASVPSVEPAAQAAASASTSGARTRRSALPVRRAFILGEVFGTAWLSAATWWMYVSLHDYGGLPAWMAALSVALLCALLSLYLALAMAVFVRWRHGSVAVDALRFGACWLLAELARAVLFTGFPWAASGYAHGAGPLASLAPWVGIYGIGFASAVLAALAGQALAIVPGWVVPLAAGVVASMLLSIVGPGRFTQASGRLALTLVQTNVSQDEKFAVERMPENLAWLKQQLLAAKGELVVAPETAVPLLPADLDPAYWTPLLERFQAGPQAALIGLPLGSYEQGYTNSVAGVSRESRAAPDGFYRYDKHHLVPFGEFIPTGFHWFTEMMNIPLGDFNRGPIVAPSFDVPGAGGNVERVAPNICYEDLFGEDLAARFRDAPTAPTIFANLSNIGWFGDTSAIPQHRQISRMRTLEFQRPMVRATNTGSTVVIDHEGRVTASMPPFTRGSLEAEVEGRVGLTPFARWAGWAGLWPPALLAIALLLAHGTWRGRRQRLQASRSRHHP